MPETVAEAPAVPVTETPEFQQAVDATVAKAVAEAMASLQATLTATKGMDAGVKQDFNAMAMAFAEMAGQGNKRQYVAPEVMEARAAARRKLNALIEEANGRREAAIDAGNEDDELVNTPIYRLTTPQYIGDELVMPLEKGADNIQRDTQLGWTGIPNHGMFPVNEIARRIYGLFNESVGGSAQLPKDYNSNRVAVPVIGGGHLSPPAPLDTREYHTTARGIVVRSRAPQRSTGGVAMPRGLDRVRPDGVPAIPKQLRVLGTIAKPFVEGYQGKPVEWGVGA